MTDTTENLEKEEEKYESLGELLRRTREERGITVDQVVDDTRVSASNIRAMEENNFNDLPADVFARGLYGHYAEALGLNPDEIIGRFLMERSSPSDSKSARSSRPQPPGIQAKDVSTMAAPTGVSPLSSIGFFLLLLFIISGAVCWYLSINPAAFLSAKLRGLQSETPLESQPSESQGNEPAASKAKVISIETTPQPEPDTPTGDYKYFLKARFTKDVSLTIALDDEPARQETFTAGSSVSLNAANRMSLSLPADSGVELMLNDIPLTLPEETGAPTTITIPEYLLE